MFSFRSVVLVCSVYPVCNLEAQQDDSLRTLQLDELVVTATRHERQLASVPMPVHVLQAQQIRAAGYLRLGDALAEQNGLVLVPAVNGQGLGLQVQGFNSDYTLILVNGEPLIGRSAGVLDLSRVAVGNIRKVEIIKGPSSSLYGSEALAGVVNIITDSPQPLESRASVRYGTNRTSDGNLSFSTRGERAGFGVYANRYETHGYDLNPEQYGNTVSPFRNITLQPTLTLKLAEPTHLLVNGRLFREDQTNSLQVSLPADTFTVAGEGRLTDWAINPVLTHRFSQKLKGTIRYYHTGYSTQTELRTADSAPYYDDDFEQSFARAETQAEYYVRPAQVLTLGVGYLFESVLTGRYGDVGKKKQNTAYVFAQYEWDPTDRLTLVAGARYDNNNVWGSQFSPKLSVQFSPDKAWAFRLSAGTGFKSPDFRQLYLNFSNTAAGYSVYGSEVVNDQLQWLDSQGQISAYLADPSALGNLSAERSLAFNGGFTFAPKPSYSFTVNGFYNSVNDLIENRAVAVTTSLQTVYSYQNINQAYTAGFEVNGTTQVRSWLGLSAGYTLLYAKDRDVVRRAGDGALFGRDPETLSVYRLEPDDYFGLYGRSRHMANAKVFASAGPWEGSLRLIYRGKYGVNSICGSSDSNGNQVLDVYDNFLQGYLTIHLSGARRFGNHFRLQGGIDNLLDYTDPGHISQLPGRLVYLAAQLEFKKQKP